MIKVIIESPYAGNIEENLSYLKQCMRDSLSRGEAPFASHLLYTQCLDDNILSERTLGIEAGNVWGVMADIIAVYADKGISKGMAFSIEKYKNMGKIIEYRYLY